MLAAIARRRLALRAVIAVAGATALVACGTAFPAADDAQVRRGLADEVGKKLRRRPGE